MQARQPFVSLVVLNYNGEQVIRDCLDSVGQSVYPLHEIVVVDNASKDRSREIIREEFPHVTLVESERNLGAPAGRNLGIERALQRRPDYVYTLDNDLAMDPRAVERLVELMEEDSGIGCAGSIIYYWEPRDLVFNAGHFVNWSQNLVKSRGMNERDHGQFAELAEVDYVGSGAMLASRKVLEEVGSFDAGFIGYGYEDTDFGLRVKRKGYRVVCLTSSKVWHRPFTGIGRYSFKKKYLEARNAVRFMRIYGTPWAWVKFSFYALAGLAYATIREGLRGNLMGVVGKARGLYDGWRNREDFAWKLLNPDNAEPKVASDSASSGKRQEAPPPARSHSRPQ